MKYNLLCIKYFGVENKCFICDIMKKYILLVNIQRIIMYLTDFTMLVILWGYGISSHERKGKFKQHTKKKDSI